MIVAILKNRLIIAPRRLDDLAKQFAGIESAAELHRLVNEYLPEDSKRLADLPPTKMAEAFIERFSRKYFPIAVDRYNRSEFVGNLVRRFSVQYHGMDRYQYDAHWNMAKGHLLAATLCECPYKDRDDRLAVIDHFTREMGEDRAKVLLEMIPAKGFPVAEVKRALAASPYPGLLVWCNWIFNDTGNIWFDSTDTNAFAWDRKQVTRLAGEWEKYQELDRLQRDFNKWLTGQLHAHTEEVIRYVSGKIPVRVRVRA